MQWEASAQDGDTLLRGAPLAEAEGWLAERGDFLSQRERAFIVASVEQRDRALKQELRRQSRLRQALVIALFFLVVAIGAAAFGFIQQNAAESSAVEAQTQATQAAFNLATSEAAQATAVWNEGLAATRERAAETERLRSERQQRLSLAQSLAALSQVVYQESFDSELSALMAIEAYRINREEMGDIVGFVNDALRPLLNSENPHIITSLYGHESAVWSVAFSPNGETLASGSGEGTIRLWNLSDPAAAPQVLRGHESAVSSVAFSPDGETLASGSVDRTIHLWVLLDELVEIGCRQVRRNLTWDEWQRYLRDEPYRQTCPDLPPHPSVPVEELSEQ